MATAAIYTRLSQDRDGTKTGTDRQEKDCRALCKREGLKVVSVFTDDDRSAYSGKTRPAFEQMLSELERFDVLVYWKTDRLVRRTSQFWRVVDACERAGVRLVSVVDPIDTSTPIGKGVAGMLAAMGEQESHNTSVRVSRKHEELAAAGKPHGHRRAFGFSPDGTSVIEAEADAIREARDRILSGESMTGICHDWNARGIKPTTAPAWRVTTFKRMITGPRLAGLRVYRGEVVGRGTWPEIISPADHEAIVATLGSPRVRVRGRPASYLLTGLVHCGRCRAVLRSTVRAGSGERRWSCRRVPGEATHCGALVATAEPVDRFVEEAILYSLDSPTVARAMKQPKQVKKPGDDIDSLEDRLVQLGIDYDAGLISRKEWLTRRAPLQERIDALRSEADQKVQRSPIANLANGPGNLRDRWAALSIEQRRSVAASLIDKVTINPPKARSPRFDPERIEVTWRA